MIASTGMRRVFWTLGLGIGGLFLGLKGQDTSGDMWTTALGGIWGGSIGYGFGTIFDQKNPTKRIVIYWAATLALVGPFFGLLIGAAMQPYASCRHHRLIGGHAARFPGWDSTIEATSPKKPDFRIGLCSVTAS